jgi:hypothetical protein
VVQVQEKLTTVAPVEGESFQQGDVVKFLERPLAASPGRGNSPAAP